MTFNDLEWLFYDKCSLLRTTLRGFIFFIVTADSVYTCDQRACVELVYVM